MNCLLCAAFVFCEKTWSALILCFSYLNKNTNLQFCKMFKYSHVEWNDLQSAWIYGILFFNWVVVKPICLIIWALKEGFWMPVSKYYCHMLQFCFGNVMEHIRHMIIRKVTLCVLFMCWLVTGGEPLCGQVVVLGANR